MREIVREPARPLTSQAQHLGCFLLAAVDPRFAHEHARAGSLIGERSERSGGEGELIRTDRFSNREAGSARSLLIGYRLLRCLLLYCISDYTPAGRGRDLQFEPRLQIRLIEAREHAARVGGDEQ